MTSKAKTTSRGTQFEFYMDLLGHDVLNSNQAVLSYLELIMANPGADKKTRALAEKAIAHIRSSTMLVENVKRILGTREIDYRNLKQVDLVKAIERAEVELGRYYPGRRMRLDHKGWPKTAVAFGNTYAADLILISLVTAVRLDVGEDVNMTLSLNEGESEGHPMWMIRIDDPNSQLPPFLDGEGVTATYAQDISLAVRTTGLLSAKMIAKNLGGDFEAHATSHEPKRRGAIFTIALRRADQP